MHRSITADNILGKIKEAGFNISLSKETHLTREMAEQLYSEHKGKDFFEDLTGLMSRYTGIIIKYISPSLLR